MIPVVYAPDADQYTPGVLRILQKFVPTERGYRAAPTPSSVGIAALSAACRGSYLSRDLSGVSRLYAGTSSGLYKANTTTWTDVSAAAYSLGANDRWSFAQFGNDTLAATITRDLQKATTGSFAAIAGAPKAQIVLTTANFVMLLHTNEGTFGDQTDRWWCSGFQDDTSWTPAVSTQCTTGRLVEGEGPITAGAVLGDDIIVFKERAMFHGRYVGAPAVWDFDRVPGNFGCVGQDAVVNIGDKLVVVQKDDIYVYDGARPYSIAAGTIKDTFSSQLERDYGYKTTCLHDRFKSNVWVFYPFGSSSLANALVFNTVSKKWGATNVSTIEAVSFWPDLLGSGNYKAESPAVFNSSHVLGALVGTPEAGLFTTGYVGDESLYTHLSRLTIRTQGNQPASATASASAYDVIGDTPVGSSSGSIDDGKFDLRQSGRWHQISVDTTGLWDFSHYAVDLKPEGRR